MCRCGEVVNFTKYTRPINVSIKVNQLIYGWLIRARELRAAWAADSGIRENAEINQASEERDTGRIWTGDSWFNFSIVWTPLNGDGGEETLEDHLSAAGPVDGRDRLWRESDKKLGPGQQKPNTETGHSLIIFL